MSRPRLPLPNEKQCLGCSQFKHCSEEHSRSGFTLMRQRGRNGNIYLRYCSFCKACEARRRRRWARTHPEQEQAWYANYRKKHRPSIRSHHRIRNAEARIDLVKKIICSVYDLSPLQLVQRSMSREDTAMEARCVALYALCVLGRMGPTEAGRAFGRNHSTVLHAIERLKAHQTHEEAWAIREVRRLLGEHRHKKRPDEVKEEFYQRRRAAHG